MNDPCQTPPRGFLDVIDVDELDDDVQLLGEASQIGNTNASNNGSGAGGEW